MMNVKDDGIEVDRVQVIDLEDAEHLEPRDGLTGRLRGNILWRSPEAHACGPVQAPSDVFSFAIVVSVPRDPR